MANVVFQLLRGLIVVPLIAYYTAFVLFTILAAALRNPRKALKAVLGRVRGPPGGAEDSTAALPPPAPWNDSLFGTHGFIRLQDVQLHYVAKGSEERPLLLLLHGFPECWYSWRHQILEFSKDYRVVAVDQRGYSLSDKPLGRASYTVDKLAADIRQLVEALGYQSCVLVGHDWGGAVAWKVAAQNPEIVSKLIILNCPHPSAFYDYTRSHWSQVPYLPEIVIRTDNFQCLEKIFLGKHGVRPEKMNKEDVEVYKYAFAQPGAVTGAINYYRALPFTSQQKPKMLTMPVLMIWGILDTALEKGLAAASGCFVEDFNLIYLASSHWVQMDQPDLVNEHMWKFLKSK